MRRSFLLLAIMGALAAVAAAQSTEAYFTGEMFNGRAWVALSESERVYYVMAMREVIGIADTKEFTMFRARATHGEIVKLMNTFFADAANANVPILLGLQYAANKANGNDPEALEKLAAAMRKLAAAWLTEKKLIPNL